MLDAMHDLDGLWDELVPAEQQRIVEVMAGRLDIGLGRCDLHLRKGGIGNLANAVRGTNEITVQEDETIVRLPLRARLRSGRTMVVAAPQPETRPTGSTRTDPLLLACARAFRWQDDLESGRVRSVSSLAEREQVDEAYVRRHLRLALVDPAIRDPHRSREWRWRYGQHQANDRRKRHDRCVGKAAA